PEQPPTSPTSSPIETFVNSFDFPKMQGVNILIDIPEENIKVFQISYGEPQDCPSGCFFSRATGIKNNNKIAWISINNYDDFDVSNLQMYDFDSSDSYLFTDEFFNKLKSRDSWVYQYAFLPLLAKDPDTPNETLLKIAEALSSDIQPLLANSLLENPSVQQNKEILTIIANLPVFSGDAYEEVRSKAQDLLNNLE
ncbi:hypothetical protein DRJ48_02135, partial [Candidatus Woesearchaeota archaeon]